jgi:predicted negative regulator of RcsB-dependent stress response
MINLSHRTRLILMGILLLVTIFGYQYYGGKRNTSENAASATAEKTPVDVFKAAYKPLYDITEV